MFEVLLFSSVSCLCLIVYFVRTSIRLNKIAVPNNGTDYKSPTKLLKMYAQAEATNETAKLYKIIVSALTNMEYNAELTNMLRKKMSLFLLLLTHPSWIWPSTSMKHQS